jgi:ER membrane protein complex subunit 3
MAESLLILDPSIRDWVVLPMVIVVILVGMGRHYVQILMKSNPTITESHIAEIRCKQILQQASRLRVNGSYINPVAYQKRKAYFIRKKTGVLREKAPPPQNPMSNPLAMVDMMKGNITFMLPNFAMMGFVSSFFSGFVCLKVPFPLPSTRFRLMLQRGVDLQTLDVSYVSSLSWYFLVTFGLNGVYKLILGQDADLDDTKMMQQQMNMGMGGIGQPGFDANGAYTAEREALGIVSHEWIAEKAERELLGDAYPDNMLQDQVDLTK